MMQCAWAREQWPLQSMTHHDWDRLAGVAFGELAAVNLPGGVRACRKNRVVQVGAIRIVIGLARISLFCSISRLRERIGVRADEHQHYATTTHSPRLA